MLSNHDVNRVAYEINQKNPDKEIAIARIKLAGSVQMTMKGMPWIYYGDGRLQVSPVVVQVVHLTLTEERQWTGTLLVTVRVQQR